jgi:hypothetical protein
MSPIPYSKDWGHDSFNSFALALDLNMGQYHIKQDSNAQNLCTVVFPWNMGKYKYKRFLMGIKIAWWLMFSKCHFKSCPRYGIC